jgi:hypothetical protein
MIIIGGIYCLGFALFHALFPRIFKWHDELGTLTPINKGIVYILNNRLAYFFIFVAAACFLFTEELATTRFGNYFLIGISLFWLGRTIEQFIYLKVDHPMVQLLTYIFILGTILFAIPVLM